jgi:hypothetical protein
MRTRKETAWGLPEIDYLSLDSLAQHRVCNRVNVDCSLVREVVEDVVGLACLFIALLTAEDEVNPLVQVRADSVTFKRSAVCKDKGLCASTTPRRQLDCVNRDAAAL